jgi:uncharacterized protein YprB with RNaseH-like and TPR domain
MIDTSFLHFKGIGRANLKTIKNLGIENWNDALDKSELIPFKSERQKIFLSEVDLFIEQYSADNLEFLCNKIHPSEKWKILSENFSRATYFDIETNGMNYGDNITLIICYHKKRVYQFLNGDNLDAFLDFLDDVSLLVSFNGTSFDIPMIENYFRIPKLKIAHLDLRWLAYHVGLKGGLKKIEKKLGIQRSEAVDGLDGMDAIYLWIEWKNNQNQNSLDRLIEYCTYDVISLETLAKKIVELNRKSVPV